MQNKRNILLTTIAAILCMVSAMSLQFFITSKRTGANAPINSNDQNVSTSIDAEDKNSVENIHQITSPDGKISISINDPIAVDEIRTIPAPNPTAEEIFIKDSDAVKIGRDISSVLTVKFLRKYPFNNNLTSPCLLLNYGSDSADLFPGAIETIINGYPACEVVESDFAIFAIVGDATAAVFNMTLKNTAAPSGLKNNTIDDTSMFPAFESVVNSIQIR